MTRMQALNSQYSAQVIRYPVDCEEPLFKLASPVILFMRENAGKRLNGDACTFLARFILEIIWEPYSNGLSISTTIMAGALKQIQATTGASSVTMVMVAYLLSKVDMENWNHLVQSTIAVVPKGEESYPDLTLPFQIVFASVMWLMRMIECRWENECCRMHRANCKKLSFWMTLGAKYFTDRMQMANMVFFLMGNFEQKEPLTLEDLEYFVETTLMPEASIPMVPGSSKHLEYLMERR